MSEIRFSYYGRLVSPTTVGTYLVRFYGSSSARGYDGVSRQQVRYKSMHLLYKTYDNIQQHINLSFDPVNWWMANV